MEKIITCQLQGDMDFWTLRKRLERSYNNDVNKINNEVKENAFKMSGKIQTFRKETNSSK